MTSNITAELKAYCKSSGADLAGIADLEPLRGGLPVIPQNLLEPYLLAISIGIHLKNDIINGIVDCPTPEYADHYRDVNSKLDNITSAIVKWIALKGFIAEAVPASRIADGDNLLGNISHKAVARMAGIGWQGKSLLIISPGYGPRIRLATVLTNIPLLADKPLKNRCGKCMECVKACPASAIKNVSTESNYPSREEAIYLEKCHTKVKEFKAMQGIGARICGVCVKACPFGRKH
ncbi:MAG: epoxyqueuosine reductase [Nitrospirae bacterium]|nr:epoxyqueuosine reductase [Nitrospirota bacterium]